MSGPGDFRANGVTSRTRLLMIGAFVGALVLLGLSVTLSWPVAVGKRGETSESKAAQEAFDAPAGSCLMWAKPDGSDMHKVSCDVPHLFEVTGMSDVSADFPAKVPPPTPDQWHQLSVTKCGPTAATYLGGKLDPMGKFAVNALRPREEQWSTGDRKLRCGLQRATVTGSAQPLTGSAAKQDQSNVYELGICLALIDKTVGDPVDCLTAHAYEIVGIADLVQLFQGVPDYPEKNRQNDKLAEACQMLVNQYSGNTDLASKKLILGWDTLEKGSWDAGSRRVNCKVGSRLADGTGLAPLSGSLKAATAPPTQTPPPSKTG